VVLENRRMLQELYRVNGELKEKVHQLESVQESLIEAERLATVHQLVVTLSHRINNSLAGILSALEILLESEEGLSALVRQTLVRVKEEASKIKTIVSRLQELKSLRTIPYLEDIDMLDLNF
jgi:signal transduction histidine kinase